MYKLEVEIDMTLRGYEKVEDGVLEEFGITLAASALKELATSELTTFRDYMKEDLSIRVYARERLSDNTLSEKRYEIPGITEPGNLDQLAANYSITSDAESNSNTYACPNPPKKSVGLGH